MTTLAHEILCAAGSGDAKAVREYLATGVPVDTANELGYTALMSAARSYRIELVDWLIEKGADVNAIANDGQSVLHAAVGETPYQPDRQGACVTSLLNAGAKPDVQTPAGHSPLMQAAWFGCVDAVKSLVAHNADLKLKDQQEKTAAEIAASRGHDGVRQILTQAHNATTTNVRDSA